MDRAALFTLTNRIVNNTLEHYKEKILGDRLKELVNEHRAMTGANHYVYGANAFMDTGRVVPISQVKFKTQASKLHDDLLPQHLEFWKDYQEYAQSWQLVSQSLRSVSMRAKSWQDLRDMLPDHVLSGFMSEPELQGLQRTRPDLYAGPESADDYQQRLQDRLIHWDEFLVKMYSRIGGTISLYLGYKFL